ncbi:MazG-like family protein [Tetragenococcus halophilus]|uniref:MazG-like family protein n=2 Tax=Tetragenococcus halophilus TaxID=51669 RepID=UPI0030C9D049
MNELIKLIEQWSKDKGLDQTDSSKQALKFFEEAGEVSAALARNNEADLKDAIGDTVVTLIILGQQQGMSLERCLAVAYDEIKGRKGKTVNSVFIKEEDLNGEDN